MSDQQEKPSKEDEIKFNESRRDYYKDLGMDNKANYYQNIVNSLKKDDN